MTLVNRPLFLHPRVLWRTGHPVIFTAEPGPGSDVLEEDAATLFAALEPLIEVLNLAGYELLGTAWSPNAVETEPVTYVSFLTMLASTEHSTWAEVVGLALPAGSDSALALQVEPRIASGYTPPLADPAELTYAHGLRVTADHWIASRQPLSTVAPGWLVHVPDHAVGTLGAAVNALGETRPRRGSGWIGRGDLGALVAELSRQLFESWQNGGGAGMLRMLQPTCWEPSAFQLTADYLTHHLERTFVNADGSLKDHLVASGSDAERGAFYADLLSWTLGDLVGWIEAIFFRTTKLYGLDLVAFYGDGAFAAALDEAADRFGKDPLLVDIMVLLSSGMLSLRSRDDRWYVEPAPGTPRIGEEPFPAPIEPTWSATDVTGFYQIVLPIPEVTIPEVPYEDPGDGSSGPAARASAELDAVFDTVQAGVEMLQVNQAGVYLECQWQGRSPNLTTDWDGDGITEVHRVGVVHGTISAKLDPASDPALPAYNGLRRMPAATTPGGTDVVHGVRLQFEPTATGNMTVRLTAVDEDWVFTRHRAAIDGEIVDFNRPHLTDRELRKAPDESRSLLWGSDRAPLHTNEMVLLLLITGWIVERLDEATPIFGPADAKAQVAGGVPALMSYFGTEQRTYAQVQLRYVMENWPYFGGIVGSMFGDEQNYWQALLVAIHEAGEELPELCDALGVTQDDIDAVLAEHHRYEYSHGTSSFAATKTFQAARAAIVAGRVGETVWLAIKTGAKALFKVVSAFEFGPDGDIDFVTFTFNKLRLKDPSNPNSDFEVDDEAPGYPAVLQGLQLTASFGLSFGVRWKSLDSSTVIKTGREQWSPTDWAGPYAILQIENGVGLIVMEDYLPNPLRFILNQLGFDHEEGKSAGLTYFYRWPFRATVPEAAWALDESWIEATGVYLNVGSIGVSVGWLCEDINTDSAAELYAGLFECLAGAQGQLPPLVEEQMESGAVLTATATAFRANASRLDDFGEPSAVDALGSFVAENLHAFRRGASSMLVHGHASPDGSELHNRCLSERRVEYVQRMVAAMLGRDFVIHPGRIQGLGLGESVSQDVSEPNDPTWRVVELAVNRSGMRMLVEAMP